MGCLHSKDCCRWHVPYSSRHIKLKESENGNGKPAAAAVSPISSDGLGEDGRDQLHQLSLTRDSSAGINRLSRVSSQFLPSDGSRTVKVPLGNYELRYSYLSQRGYYPDALDKANQDSFCIHTPFGTSPDDHFFGVFDGHGEYGAQCSQFVKRKLCENLLKNGQFCRDPVESCHAAFLTTNSQLHSDSLDDTMSGTTAITVLVRGKTIYVANCGDSRAVIAEKRGNDIVAIDLSIDQTPFRADELERVELSGARVLTLDQIEGLKNPDMQCWDTEEGDDGDPPRVWVQNGMYPGTAFTRSIGDSIAESIGVVANPEIAVLELTENHPFFVLASDGVFEFLSSQTVVDMVAKSKDPRDACAAIVAESYRLWLQYETRTDDITVIVVHVNGLSDTGSIQSAAIFDPRSPPQVVEVTGSESPSTFNWNSRNNRVRHDLSRARLRAIECSLDNGNVWVPPSPSHRKTWEEEAHIERVLHDHFLFRRLTDSQCRVLLDCMQRVEVKSGEIVVQQGGEGDCFYVVGSGEFEVFATQEEENGKEVIRVLHKYTAEKLSSFGELALMYNKPLQASVRAVTGGTLWSLKREDFRGILMSEFSNLSSLKLLRSVELFSRMTILQLNNISSMLEEISYSDGQTIMGKLQNSECISALHIILKGQVRVTYDGKALQSQNIRSLPSVVIEQECQLQNNSENEVLFSEGDHFGEWTLLGEKNSSLSAVAVGEVVCAIITKDKFDSAVGPLSKLLPDDCKLKHSSLNSLKGHVVSDATTLSKVQLSDLEWRMCISATDCSELGLVLLKGSDNVLSLKRFSKMRINQLGKEAQVLKERDLMKSLSQSTHVPRVLCTCADHLYLGMLLNICLSCSLSSILYKPLDEASARFCAASVVVALEELHSNAILYRGVSPEMLMFDQHGHLQLVDFRFGKKLEGERTFTICGIADTLSPEILKGSGHGFGADWWALGVLIYFMLEAEMPFVSWREGELDTFAKIAKGHLTLPETFSGEVIDLITKLLEVDETARLGSEGVDSIMNHPWFQGLDWKAFANCTAPVPQEISSRIDYYLGNRVENATASISSSEDTVDLNYSDWLQEW